MIIKIYIKLFITLVKNLKKINKFLDIFGDLNFILFLNF